MFRSHDIVEKGWKSKRVKEGWDSLDGPELEVKKREYYVALYGKDRWGSNTTYGISNGFYSQSRRCTKIDPEIVHKYQACPCTTCSVFYTTSLCFLLFVSGVWV